MQDPDVINALIDVLHYNENVKRFATFCSDYETAFAAQDEINAIMHNLKTIANENEEY